MIRYCEPSDRYHVYLTLGQFIAIPGYFVRDLLSLPISELCKFLSVSDVSDYISMHTDHRMRDRYAVGLHIMIRSRLEGLW